MTGVSGADLKREARDADGVEIAPVRYFQLHGERFAEVNYGERTHAWGVYWHLKAAQPHAGGALHVSDHRLKANAWKKARKLLRMLRKSGCEKPTILA